MKQINKLRQKISMLAIIIGCLLLSVLNSGAANYYWVGGTGNWSEFATHWATSSGGAVFHIQAPTDNDDVFFDANSFSGALQTVTVDVFNAECRNMNWTGAINNPTLTGMNSITIYGSLTFIPAMSCTMSGGLYFSSNNPATTINTAGLILTNIQQFSFQMGSTGTWTLLSDINLASAFNSIMFNDGNLNTNGYTINCKNINIMGSAHGSWTLGNSTINCTSFSLMGTPAILALNPGTSTINIINGNSSFMGNGYTFYNMNFDGLSSGTALNLNGSMTFETVSFNNIETVLFPANTTVTVKDIQFNGTCNKQVVVCSNNSGFTANIFKTNGNVNEDYIAIKDITVLGGGIFVSDNSSNLGNVHNWTINAPVAKTLYWIGGNGNWNDPVHWSLSSGGPQAGSCAPSIADNVIFDVNSFSAAGQKVSIDGNAFCHDITWTGVANNPDLAAANSWGDAIFISGDFILDVNMTATFNGSYNFTTSDPAQLIATQNIILAGSVYFSGTGGWGLVQGLQCAAIYFNQGSLNTNNQNLITGSFFSNSSLTRNISLGASNIQITSTWQIQDASNLIFNSGTSNIGFSSNATFQGGHQIYNNIGFNGDVSIYHNNTFANLAFNAGKTVTLESGATQTITGFVNAVGNCGNYITFKSGTDGSQATISKSIGIVTVSYSKIKDIKAIGGATFSATNSTDMGNNTGWTITAPVATTYYWIAGTGNWNDPTHWSTSSGGAAGTCIPSWADNVVFDGGSGLPARTVTVNVTSGCNNFTWSVPNATLAGTSADLYVGGNFTLNAGMIMNFGSGMGNNSLIFNSNNPGNIITLAGKTVLANIEFDGTGSWSLAGAMNCGRSVYLHKGNLNMNNFAMSCNSFYSQTTAVRQLTLGNQTHTLSGGWYLTDGTNFTLNAGTYTLNIASSYFYGGDKTYNIVNMNINGYCYLFGNNIFATLNIPNSKNVSLEGGKSQTVVNLTLLSGTNCNNFNNLYSDNPGTPATIIKNGAAVNMNFMNISDVRVSGTAIFTANNSIGIGDVTGWIINPYAGTTLYWVGGTGDWNQAIHWSGSSGGLGGLCVPTTLDDVIFDANSFPNQDTVTLNSTGYCKSMNWTGAGFNPLFQINGNLNINGSLTFIPAMDIYTYSTLKFISSTPANTITTAGQLLYYISFDGSGTYSLQDNLNFSYIYFNNGTLNTNNFSVLGGSNGTFTSNSTSARILNLGNSNIQVNSWDITDPTNLTINAGTSEITLNNNPWQFRGGNKSYYNLNITPSGFGGYTTIYGSNSFNRLKLNPGCDIRFESGKTQTTTDLDATGDPGNLISLSAATAGNFSSISQATPFCGNYLDIKDMHVTGTTFYAGNNSNNLGGNLGWTWSGMIANDQYPPSMCEDIAGSGTVAGINLTTYNTAIDGGTGSTHTWYSDAAITTLVSTPTNVTVSDGLTFWDLVDNGTCTEVAIIVFTVTPKPVLSFIVTNVSCFGGTNGAIDMTVSSGTAPYTYLWNSGQITEDITNIPIGCYTVTVTDNNGCSNIGTACVTQPSQITISLAVTNVLCFGGNNGAINMTVAGGVGPYTYLWTGGMLTEDLSGLTAGTYNVTVTDANLCTATGSTTLTQPLADLTITGTVTNITCNGYCNGAITVLVSGGTPPYSYSWSTGSIVATIINLCDGIYSLTVTDSNGCTATYTGIVTQPPALSVTTTQTNVLINGQCTGTATANPTGGVGSYTYVWNTVPIQLNQTATGLCAGTYHCTITDGNGCTITIPIINITQPAPLILSETHTNVTCFGLCNGTATLTPSGGVPAYMYTWSPVGSNPAALCAGTYGVTVTDMNGATASTSFTITQPMQLTISKAVTNITCNGLCNGAIDITISGGTPAYTTSWSNSATTQDITNLCAGTYTVTVTDSQTCTATNSTTLNNPPAITANAGPDQGLCANVGTVTLNGSIAVATGGTWSGGGGTYNPSNTDLNAVYTPTAPELSAGTIILTLTTTGNGSCAAATDQVTIDFDPIPAANAGVDQGVCITTPIVTLAGTVTNATGGTWSGGTGTFNPNNTTLNASYTASAAELAAGTVTLTLTSTGNGNCTAATDNIVITYGSALNPLVITPTPTSCNSYCDGLASVTVTGGTPPFTYLWSDFSTSPNAINLCAGTIFVTVTDTYGCTATEVSTIGTPMPLITGSQSYNSTCGNSDGAADVDVSGGTPGYTYLWDDLSGSTTDSISGLPAGIYHCTISDTHGCTQLETVTVSETGGPTILSTMTNDASCAGLCDGSVIITVTGSPSYNCFWSNGMTTSVATLTNLCAGNYNVTIQDVGTGCETFGLFAIGEPYALTINMVGTPATANGACDGTAAGTPSHGTAPYTYLWNDLAGSTTPMITGLCAGTYCVTITDNHGCTITDCYIVNEPETLNVVLTPVNPLCAGCCCGSITTTVTGGVTPYSYNWSNGSTTATLTNLCAGTYIVTVTDNSGITVVESVTLIDPPAIVIAINSIPISCHGLCDGSLTASVTGGAPPYIYMWSTGAIGQTINNLCAGNYCVTVTDINGCTSFTCIILTEPTALSSNITNSVNLLCNGIPTGSATLTPIGGTIPYIYLWDDGQTDSTAVGLLAGVFNVTVTDNSGCTVISTATIIEPTAMVLTTHGYDAACGSSNGSASVDVTGATPPFVYLWNDIPGSTSDSISNLPAGMYTVTVTDLNLCTSTASVAISNIGGPVIDNILIIDVTCSGNCDGTATISVSGGSGTYTIDWSNGVSGTNTSITGLCAGIYSVTITDDISGCITIEIFTISEPLPLTLTMSSTDDHGTGDGTATVTTTGGVPPYTYNWDANTGNQITPTAINLVNGTYYVTVTDANMCTASNMVVVNLFVSVVITESNFIATLYPNPTSDEINLRISNNTGNEKVQILIMNNLGEIVVSRKELILKGNSLFNFDLRGTAPGLYYVRLIRNTNNSDIFKHSFTFVKTE